MVSNYIWRGMSPMTTLPSRVVLTTHSSGFYAGTWVSNVDFGDGGPGCELDFYGGFGGSGRFDNGSKLWIGRLKEFCPMGNDYLELLTEYLQYWSVFRIFNIQVFQFIQMKLGMPNQLSRRFDITLLYLLREVLHELGDIVQAIHARQSFY